MSIPRAVIEDQGSKTVSDALRNVSNVNEVDPRESNNVGYKAASYWDTRDVLKEIGAISTRGRIVVDRNRITDGGVTAGIDFGLKLVALLKSRVYAEAVQLYLEYDPLPPFNAGSPEKAQPLARQFLKDMFAGMRANALATAQVGDAETAERANLRWSPPRKLFAKEKSWSIRSNCRMFTIHLLLSPTPPTSGPRSMVWTCLNP